MENNKRTFIDTKFRVFSRNRKCPSSFETNLMEYLIDDDANLLQCQAERMQKYEKGIYTCKNVAPAAVNDKLLRQHKRLQCLKKRIRR